MRSILEGVMNDAMYELPSKGNVKTLSVAAAFVEEKFRKTSMAHLKVA